MLVDYVMVKNINLRKTCLNETEFVIIKMLETNGTCTCNKGLLSNCGQDCFYL